MKHFKKVLPITTTQQVEFQNLSYVVEEYVRQSGIINGICVVMSQHTTASVFLEHDNEQLYRDWERMLSHIVHNDTEYKVDYNCAGAAHMKQLLLGASVTVPITDGKLDLGPRQYIMFGDFDGQREKGVVVKIIGE